MKFSRKLSRLRRAGCILALSALGTVLARPLPAQPHRLRVAADGRHLEYADGGPFFYLGDTAWELFHRLNAEEAEFYLRNRAQKGFTVIQAVVLSQLGGPDGANAYGDPPLLGRDPARPNEAYFRHVDRIIDKAASLGLFVGLLPTWGSYWKQVGRKQPPLFNIENARAWGRFLGRRYRDRPLIGILGGDENIESDGERAVIEAMAAGLKEGDGGAHLVTYHPRGPGLSSDYFHAAPWLDFNMYQSSHGGHDHDNGLYAEHDYALAPPKPTLDGEPRYETIPVGFYFRDANRLDRFDAYDVRQAAYWSLLAGACGHTYGHNSVWQMWQPGREPLIGANIPWREALDHPGAFQMGLLKRLFASRPFEKLAPAPRMILDGPRSGGARTRAACARDGSFAFIYSPRGEPFTLNKGMIRARRVKEIWFDPRYGATYEVHTTDNAGFQTYTPPTRGRGHDWLLILEGAEVR